MSCGSRMYTVAGPERWLALGSSLSKQAIERDIKGINLACQPTHDSYFGIEVFAPPIMISAYRQHKRLTEDQVHLQHRRNALQQSAIVSFVAISGSGVVPVVASPRIVNTDEQREPGRF